MDSFQSCPSCGRKLSLKFTACPYCHAALGAQAAQAPQAASPSKEESQTDAAPRDIAPTGPADQRSCPNCGAALEPGSLGCSTCGHGRPEASGGPKRLATLALLLIGIAAMVVVIVVFSVRKHNASKEQEQVVASGGKADDTQLLEKAFSALQSGDLSAYQKLTVTPADFLAMEMADQAGKEFERATGRKQNMVGRKLRANQSYAGGVLVPEQRKLQEEDFRKAVAGGPGFIDFKTMKFKGVGTLVARDRIPVLEGEPIPVRVYSVRVAGPDGERDTKELAPLFVVTDYQGDPTLIGLRMPQAE